MFRSQFLHKKKKNPEIFLKLSKRNPPDNAIISDYIRISLMVLKFK